MVDLLESMGPASLPVAPSLIDGLASGIAFERPLLVIGAPAVPLLAAALARDDPVLRSRAAETLGRMGTAAEPAIPALRALLDDPDDEVRREAERAIGRIRPTPEGTGGPPTGRPASPSRTPPGG
jgi:HEAT repeat protein